ncbi:MAG: hypothetical protein JST04_05835 [Bdellovibrionales bacterium]|nr:hypothetical protein [Bdellovibrionales bacterium]
MGTRSLDRILILFVAAGSSAAAIPGAGAAPLESFAFDRFLSGNSYGAEFLDPPTPECGGIPEDPPPAPPRSPTPTPFPYPELTTRTFNAGPQPISVLTGPELAKAFALVNQPSLVFDYQWTGCAQRSYRMSEMLAKAGIHCVQAFIQPQKGTMKTSSTRPIPGKSVDFEWNYHIAPLVYYRETPNAEPTLVALDPGMNPKLPTDYEYWESSLVRRMPRDESKARLGFPAYDYSLSLLSRFQYGENFHTQVPTGYSAETDAQVDVVLQRMKTDLIRIRDSK